MATDPAGAFVIAEAIERNLRMHTSIRKSIETYRNRNEMIASGQLTIGAPGNWFRSIRWSDQAWYALHGNYGPRGRRR